MSHTSADSAIRAALQCLDAAWRTKQFDGLERCFDDHAVIVGPNYLAFATVRKACAESYREFATSAAVIEYVKTDHQLRSWSDSAVCTVAWQIAYARDKGSKREAGNI